MLQQRWTVLATAEQVSAARRQAITWAEANDVPEPPIFGLRLALSEALANAAIHAYEPESPGEVTVTMTIDEGKELCVRVADQGRGMRPRTDSPGLGLGLPLMSTLAESIDIRSAPGAGNEIAMTFLLH